MRTAVYPYPQNRSLPEQLLGALLTGAATFGLILLIALVGFQIWFAGRIFPGVTIAGVDVGGLTQSQAAEKISVAFNYPATGKILLQDQQNGWVAAPQELGLLLDSGASAKAAFNVGRSGFLTSRLGDQITSLYQGKSISPALVFNENLAYYYLNQLSGQINTPTIEASLALRVHNQTSIFKRYRQLIQNTGDEVGVIFIQASGICFHGQHSNNLSAQADGEVFGCGGRVLIYIM